jgi:putative protein kinase ArgK-like GTPase of G3E family
MNFFSTAIAISILSLSTLTACGGDNKTSLGGAGQPAAEPAKIAVANSKMVLGEGITSMQDSITSLTAAVKAKDFMKAKDEAQKLHDTWIKVKEGVATKSTDNYKTINDNLYKTKTELAKTSPQESAVLASVEPIKGLLNKLVASK